MPYDDNELGAEGGVWARADNSGSNLSSAKSSITKISLEAFRAERPDPRDVLSIKTYDIGRLGEISLLPEGFVASCDSPRSDTLSPDFNPYQIWNLK